MDSLTLLYFWDDDSNIEGIWGFLQKCHEQGWLAPDYRVMPWCPRCEASLSQHESKGAYKDVTHRSVYVQLPLDNRDESLLVWTPPPWTLWRAILYLFTQFQVVHPVSGFYWIKPNRFGKMEKEFLCP